MGDAETMRPCPRCERCTDCEGIGSIRVTSGRSIQVKPCETCEACAVCGATGLVTIAARAKWLEDNRPPPTAA